MVGPPELENSSINRIDLFKFAVNTGFFLNQSLINDDHFFLYKMGESIYQPGMDSIHMETNSPGEATKAHLPGG